MPPANSMVNQETLLYCGRSSSSPSRTLPNLLNATTSRNSSHSETPMMKNQPRLVTTQLRLRVKTACVSPGYISSTMRMTTISAAETKKIVGLVRRPSRSASRSSIFAPSSEVVAPPTPEAIDAAQHVGDPHHRQGAPPADLRRPRSLDHRRQTGV